MKRTAFLGTTAGALATLAATAPAAADTPAVRLVGSLSSAMDAAIYYPLQQGWFKAAGLDVTVEPITAGPAAMAGVVGGSMQTADGNVLSLAVAHSKGIPVVLIALRRKLHLGIPNLGWTHRRTGGAIAQGSRRRYRRGSEPSRLAHRFPAKDSSTKMGSTLPPCTLSRYRRQACRRRCKLGALTRLPCTIRSAARRSRKAGT